MSGRTREALRSTASRITLTTAWSAYLALSRHTTLDSYSFSLETHVFYDARRAADRKQLLDLYSDGVNPINMMAIKDVFNRKLVYSDIVHAACDVIDLGHVPFIGHWNTPFGFYTGLSIAVNHGISDLDVLNMLKQHNQMCVARLSVDRLTYFPRAF